MHGIEVQDTLDGSADHRGITSSLRVASSQMIWPGKALTSGTSWVVAVRAQAPQTPRSKGIRRQPMLPWYGPTTRSRGATTR